MYDFKETEERILKFWDEQKIFAKSLQARIGKKPFVFFEGPPTANGSPGIHHFIGRSFKDLICRYQTMRGRYVLRRGGWDTHGLPVELQVEKSLGFTSKKDIEKYGIAEFNKKCRESVWQYRAEWEKFTKRMGFWIDLAHSYVTYETQYIESLWQIISRFNKKKYLYQAHRVVPFCTRCGTPLSNHEVAQGYKTITETSVTLKFKITKSPSKLKLPDGTFILAWTTTPWTLPGNVALAVGSDIKYVLASKNGEHYLVAEERANAVLGAPLAIKATYQGKDLVGIQYESLFSVQALKSPKSYRVYPADFVTTTDGTGVVHTAVMYGDDDYRLGDKIGLPKIHTVNQQGTFQGVSPDLDGLWVKSDKVEKIILDHLQTNNNLLDTAQYSHEYPFCWRCDTPLLYYASDSWFVKTSAVNKQMLASNETIKWTPDHLKNGRFGQWLKEARDWTFSRERFWGTPLPVWASKDSKGTIIGAPLVIGSLADIEKYRPRKANRYILVRHGESEHNVSKILDDPKRKFSLTNLGEKQVIDTANTLKKRLSRQTADIIISSPILRAKQTAEIIAKTLGIKKIEFDDRLKEIHLGPTLDGRPDDDYDILYPTYQDKFEKNPPDGESLANLHTRVWELIRELEGRYEDKTIIVVSHEYTSWMFADVANGWTQEESITEREKRVEKFLCNAGVEHISVRYLPRDENGVVDCHRPFIDDIVLRRVGSRTILHRVPDVVDCWFDSGSMPYAQWHWPFDGSEQFGSQFPADFIGEGIDQTRGWFYTLLAVSTLLGNPAPYKSVLCYSHVLDEKGQKMSKSKGNIVSPDEAIAQTGVDAMRWYFYAVNNPGDPKLFSIKEVRERLTGFIGTLTNCLRFFELSRDAVPIESANTKDNMLDIWIKSRLESLQIKITECLNTHDATTASRAIESFVVDDFSQWWLRRSRKRAEALPIIRELLQKIAILIAPFVPFIAEEMWQKVRNQHDSASVHLADWISGDKNKINEDIHEKMDQIRMWVTAGLAIRKAQNIRVRQPLLCVNIPAKSQLDSDFEELIREELNVKQVVVKPDAEVSLDTTITPALRAEWWAREVLRAIQDLRKEAGYRVSDKIHCRWHTDNADLANALRNNSDNICRDALLSKFDESAQSGTHDALKEMEIEPGKNVTLAVWK